MRSIGKHLTIVFATLLLTGGTLSAQVTRIVTTTTDLADLASRLGGKSVLVEAIAQGDQDPHRILAKPSGLLRIRRADMLIQVGLDLEHAWLPALLQSARNPKLVIGKPGFVDASVGIVPLDVPKSLARSAGLDFHSRGNPHYNLDPEGGRYMARNIARALTAANPAERESIERELKSFEADLDAKLRSWEPRFAKLKGAQFVTRHGYFNYLAQRAQFKIIADLEPLPGVDPSPAHVAAVMEIIRRERPSALIVPTFKADGVTESVSRSTGIKVIALPMGSTGKGVDATYLSWLDHVVTSLSDAVTDPPKK